MKTASLTDYSRSDPFAPSSQPREVVISTFRPAANNCTVFQETSYMRTNTVSFESSKLSTAYSLPASLFANVTLSTAAASCSASVDRSLLFSPALGTSHHLYNLLAANLAGRGYAVTTIGHPYDVDVVEFPNGTLIYGLDFNDTQIPLIIEMCAQDTHFMLDLLSPSGTPAVTLALGHSLGGAAVLAAAAEDTRLQFVVNVDGSVLGDVLDMCVTHPVVFFGYEGKDLTTDETWEAVKPRLGGWKEFLMLDGLQHYTFSDLPALAVLLGLDVSNSEALTGMLGMIKGTKAITRVLDSFVHFVVRKKEATWFDAIFPEVVV